MFGEYKLKTLWGTITTSYNERREKWILLRNERETYYNNKREMREWDTEEEAIEWIEARNPLSAKKR